MTYLGIEPIKTDYRGITFRSRTEAMQVWMIDWITMHKDSPVNWTYWQYEPRLFNRFFPDFVLFTECGFRIVIEFKSIWPTSNSWLRWFTNNVRQGDRKVSAIMLLAVSPWQDDARYEAWVEHDLPHDRLVLLDQVCHWIFQQSLESINLSKRSELFRPDYDKWAEVDLLDHSENEIRSNIRRSMGMMVRNRGVSQ